MARAPLTEREWLQEMRRFASRDADRATVVLDRLDLCDALEQQDCTLRGICVDAGLLNEGDYVTDPLPLLQMFLPS